jgi:hypothetical protein
MENKYWHQKLMKGFIAVDDDHVDVNDEANFYDNDRDLLDANDLSTMFVAHLYAYSKFSQKLFATSKEVLQTHKKGKNDIILANVKASSQMEDKIHQLGLGERQLEFLLLELENEQALGPNPHVSMDA